MQLQETNSSQYENWNRKKRDGTEHGKENHRRHK